MQPLEYPIQLALAYLFFVGYLGRTAFLWASLPGAVGVILSGFAFSYFIQPDILAGRDHLQGLAFFLVLLTAGFEISLADLKTHILAFSVLPGTCELLGMAAYAVHVMEYTKVEGLVLGTALFCLGDGLVIPRMEEFKRAFPGHPLPRLVFMFAPLEASYALTLFGVLKGLAEPARQPSVNVPLLVFANLLRITATVAVGALLGSAAGWYIPRRTELKPQGKSVFTGAAVEAYLMILAVALAGFGLGAAAGGHVVVPMVFSPGSLFQPELLVIVIGSFFAFRVDSDTLHQLEVIVGGVWVFGQLILFSMLGSKTDPSVFMHLHQILPLMAIGLSCRFVGVFVVTYGTVLLGLRPCTCASCRKADLDCAVPDAIFCFLSSLPRATIQGALGPVPLAQKFFSKDVARTHVETFIATSARLYIVCMSVGGSILLDAYGPRMLKLSKERAARYRCASSIEREEQLADEGWTAQQRRRSASLSYVLEAMGQLSKAEAEAEDPCEASAARPSFPPASADMVKVESSLETLAKEMSLEQTDIMDALRGLQAPPPRERHARTSFRTHRRASNGGGLRTLPEDEAYNMVRRYSGASASSARRRSHVSQMSATMEDTVRSGGRLSISTARRRSQALSLHEFEVRAMPSDDSQDPDLLDSSDTEEEDWRTVSRAGYSKEAAMRGAGFCSGCEPLRVTAEEETRTAEPGPL